MGLRERKGKEPSFVFPNLKKKKPPISPANSALNECPEREKGRNKKRFFLLRERIDEGKNNQREERKEISVGTHLRGKKGKLG